MPKNANFDKKLEKDMIIALTGRPSDTGTTARIADLAACLAKNGVTVYCHDRLFQDIAEVLPDLALDLFGFSSDATLPEKTSMLLALGGDGTYLSALELVRGRDIPVAGINFGRLGFLTTAAYDDNSDSWISALLSNDYEILERDVLKVASSALPQAFFPYALNEFVIRRGDSGMLSVDVAVNGKKLPPYWADGLMFVTATGSTAYSLSLGGPVISPDSRVMLITPLASHNLNVRPMVIPVGSTVEMTFHASSGTGVFSADNRSVEVPSGSVFTITKDDFPLKSVSINDNNFIKALRNKLFWGEDKRNIE